MGACEPASGSTPSNASSSSGVSGEGGMMGCLASSSGSTASSASASSSGGGGSGGGGSGGDDGHCDVVAKITKQADVQIYYDCTTLGGIYVDEAENVDDAGVGLSIDLPNLKSVSKHIYLYHNATLTHVSLAKLTSIGTYLYIDTNDKLASFDAGALIHVDEYVYVVGNKELNSFNVPSLEKVGQTTTGKDYTYILNNPSLCINTWTAGPTGSVTILNNNTCCP
jgi:hypothetical protein